jgi:hypothetical protein
MHTRQCTSNLLGRVAGLQGAGDLIPQRGSWSQAARNARCDRAGMGARRGRDASSVESSRFDGVRETASKPSDSTPRQSPPG